MYNGYRYIEHVYGYVGLFAYVRHVLVDTCTGTYMICIQKGIHDLSIYLSVYLYTRHMHIM